MIHYHGTPITPLASLYEMAGRHFCVSYPRPDSLKVCARIGASLLLDNGAFSTWKRGAAIDWSEYYDWVAPYARHPNWLIIPDIINGGEAENDALLASCPIDPAFAAPVWHMNESLDRLRRLIDLYPRICFGSTEATEPGSLAWCQVLDQAFGLLAQNGGVTWVHMLRAMKEASAGDWPFASCDSSNLAVEHKGREARNAPRKGAEALAKHLDARNPRFGLLG